MTDDATTVRYGQIDREYATRLATTPSDQDGPIWMVNLMSYRARADYGDGDDRGITGRGADDLYTPLGPLSAVGAEVVFVGDVDTQFLNDTPKWDRVGVVKYPSRRAFIEMQARADFRDLHRHKEAGMASTIVVGTQPMQVPAVPDDAPSWSDVPHPATAVDGPVMVVHVLKFHALESVTEMASYTNHAAQIAVPHGVRIAAWMQAEGTIVGDGRTWDQVRFNAFPSRAAFMKVVFDPDRLAAQAAHREVALADTYTLIVRPSIDRLHDSLTN